MTPQSPRPAATRSSPARRTGRASTFRIGRIVVTPFRGVVALAYFASAVYVSWAILRVRDSAQVPMVATGIGVLGLAFAATSAGGAVRMWQAWKAGRERPMILWAVFGGIAGMLALGCLAVTLILSLVWRS